MTIRKIDRAYWSGLLKRLARFRRDCIDEEDLLHSAFVRLELYRENHAVEDRDAFLVKTAIDIAIDAHREEKSSQIRDLAGLRQWPDGTPLQDEALEIHARLERVREGLQRLPPRTRDILLMHRLEGRKYKEIAAHFGISRSAVEKHIARAMLFLSDWTEGW